MCGFGTFSTEDKSNMTAILSFVQPFKLLTDHVQSESYPTISLIYLGIMQLIETLEVRFVHLIILIFFFRMKLVFSKLEMD